MTHQTLTITGTRGRNGDLITKTYTVRSEFDAMNDRHVWAFVGGQWAQQYPGGAVTVFCRHGHSIRTLVTDAWIEA